MKKPITFQVTVEEAGQLSVVYTGVKMEAGESKADMLASLLDDHRELFMVNKGAELTASARVER